MKLALQQFYTHGCKNDFENPPLKMILSLLFPKISPFFQVKLSVNEDEEYLKKKAIGKNMYSVRNSFWYT